MKKIIQTTFSVILVCIALSGCGNSTNQSLNEAQQVETQVSVKITNPKPATDALFIEAQGKVTSNSSFAIPALSEGKLVKTYINSGEPVKKGQTIAQLVNSESNTELLTQQEKLKMNQNAINVLEKKLKTAREMVNLGIIPQNDIMAVQNDINSRRLERQDILLPVRKLQIRNANNSVASNYSGYIVSILPQGSFVTFGQTIASVVSLKDLYVATLVPVDEVNSVKSGQSAFISTGGISVTGKIVNIYPDATSNLIKILVRPDKPLPVNLDVKVKLKRKVINGLVIPKSAVVINEGNPTIFVIKGNKAYQKTISIQKDYVDKVIVSQGLNANDRVVTDNAYLLSNGVKVAVK